MRNTTLPITTNTVIDTSTQTPIEIALQIDENGMTSLRNLYEFLEFSPSQFTRWCKKNVLENPFATENVDYITIRLDVDSPVKGQNKIEYLITSFYIKNNYPLLQALNCQLLPLPYQFINLYSKMAHRGSQTVLAYRKLLIFPKTEIKNTK